MDLNRWISDLSAALIEDETYLDLIHRGHTSSVVENVAERFKKRTVEWIKTL